MRRLIIGTLAVVLTIGTVFGQGDCPAIVDQALNSVDQFCEQANRNQACYGNVALTAEPKADVQNFTFQQSGDIVDVADIASLKLNPMDEVAGTWGVVLMRLQANLPDTMPGQNVTFLLFGDVSLEPNLTAETTAPMQAFYLKTGIGDAPCAEAPSSGLIVQTPEGAQQVAFNVNGVDVQMGSTVLFRANPDQEEMTVSALEGAATVELDDELYPIIAGTWAKMPMDGEFNITDAPDFPTAYKKEVLDALPVDVLDRQIEVHPPLNDEELAVLHEYLAAGTPPCGDVDGLFPSCEHLPVFNSNDPNMPKWASGDRWGAPLPPIENQMPSIITLDDGSQCALRPLTPDGTSTPLLPCSQVIAPDKLQVKIDSMVPNAPMPMITLDDGTQCIIRAFPDAPVDPNHRFCDETLTTEQLSTKMAEQGIKLPDGNGLPFNDTRTCVMQPGPNDPPLPANETRPFCTEIQPPLNGDGVKPPDGNGLHPLDNNGTPPPDGNGLPPLNDHGVKPHDDNNPPPPGP